MGDRAIPMFPLSLVLFPGQILPLHIFEDRYRTMVEEIIDKDREFGVVLIERGSEIGGGDTRKNVGTLAEIIETDKRMDAQVTAIEANRMSPDLVPAAALVAKEYLTDDKKKNAIKGDKKAWESQPHP